jgi:Zn-dependent oligopeptidase
VLLHTTSCLQVHSGPEGRLLLTGLLDATEQAREVLATQQPQQQQQQQQLQQQQQQQQQLQQQQQQQQQQQSQQQENGVLFVPQDSQLCLLRLSTDVLQLLLTHHPHPGVRQQLYLSGLLPLLHLQDQVLGCVQNLRRRLAAEQAAAGEGYAQLVLSGSCLGGAQAGAQLVQQLLPFAREHARAEWQQLQQLAARQARADGRRVGGPGVGAAVEPWDVAYTSLRLVRLTGLGWD